MRPVRYPVTRWASPSRSSPSMLITPTLNLYLAMTAPPLARAPGPRAALYINYTIPPRPPYHEIGAAPGWTRAAPAGHDWLRPARRRCGKCEGKDAMVVIVFRSRLKPGVEEEIEQI